MIVVYVITEYLATERALLVSQLVVKLEVGFSHIQRCSSVAQLTPILTSTVFHFPKCKPMTRNGKL